MTDPTTPRPLFVPTVDHPFPDPIPGIIPFGTVTLFAGAPGVGKTAMLADWIIRWRDGRTIWGHPTNPPTAFCYIAADRQWASHQQWFNAVGFPDIPRYSLVDDPGFNPELLANPHQAMTLLTQAIDKSHNGNPPPPGAHVFIDPASPIFIAGSPNSAREVARSLVEMSRHCSRRQINLTTTAHFGKQIADKTAQYRRPQDRIAGSGAFSGFSDTQIYLVDPEPPDHPFHVLGWNPRHQPPEEFNCTRAGNGLFVPYDVMQEDVTGMNVLDCLTALGDGLHKIVPIVDLVQEKHGHSRGTTKRALDRLRDQGHVLRLGHGKATTYQRVRLH